MSDDTPAPGSLELVRAYVNSVDLEAPELDAFVSAEGARSLFRRLGTPHAGLVDADLPALVRLREDLRVALEAHYDPGSSGPEDLSVFSGAGLAVEAEGGVLRMGVAGPGIDGVRAFLAAAIWEAQVLGTWPRLKACRRASCRAAFYDSSKNGSGAWCSMKICGNRAKAARRRLREQGRSD